MSTNELSPAKTMRPLEMHSPNASNIDQDDVANTKSTPVVKATPSSSYAPRMPSIDDEDNGENRRRGGGGGRETSFRLSPIGRVDFFGTPGGINGNDAMMEIAETPIGDRNATFLEGTTRRMDGTNVMDASFPDNRDDIEIHSPNAAIMEEEEEVGAQEETEEERMRREIEESEALARQLMAEEAMASYAMSSNYLQDNADQFSSEDLAALQAAMAEEDPEVHEEEEAEEEEGLEGELSYDALLRLGERIGDVKEERWALVAREKMDQLPTLEWTPSMAEGQEENHTEVKCQVCQFPYEGGDVLRRLPCGHCFHRDCVDSWLETKDTCAFCRKSIVPEK